MLDRDSHLFREVFEETEILKKPTAGYVSGYHMLPYILLGRSLQKSTNVVEIRGRITVSPKFVISPEVLGPTYGDLFGCDGIDENIVGRIFAFPYVKKNQVNIESEELTITNLETCLESALAAVYDELERKEIINTGVIFTPNVRFYPVSLEKFILKILDREF
ncbi:MAG: hypothetical protein C4520_11145 [Candidatus Abyssobacteria bacterium SURF_5]|uniref:Uncharacterized protein n=1 Tax=Abyssobacteria bacterium (strain SURF_5) TaxID=2093360 RepID=A0A3A4NY42_ABYX5|nr:MAG: hypothetical protein C4520_11145 [Candidatus Abyssubacteria bacterium SURF_5]